MDINILKKIKKSIIQGNGKEALVLTEKAIKNGISAIRIVQEGLVPGIQEVGSLFGRGEYFLPELIISGKAIQGALESIEPILAKGENSFHTGNYLIGSAKGDIHDIGKKIVIMMLKSNGWAVTDLGLDVSPEQFCLTVRDGNYDILGISCLLTMTMQAAADTIKALQNEGLREKVRIMVGGAPVTQAFADEIGADAYGENAWDAVEKAKAFIKNSE